MTFAMTRLIETTRIGKLQRAPLRLALVQARTPPLLEFEDAKAVKEIAAQLDGWELADRQKAQELNLKLGPDGVEQQRSDPETVWIFTNEDGLRAVLSAGSIALETESYGEWDELRTALAQVWDGVARTVGPSRCTRLGVRYVNELRESGLNGTPEGLAPFLADELVALPLAFRARLERSISETRVELLGDGSLTLRHGLVADDVYLLDFDAFSEDEQPFEVTSLVDHAERLHHQIESAFSWALRPEYLESLRGTEEST